MTAEYLQKVEASSSSMANNNSNINALLSVERRGCLYNDTIVPRETE